MQNQLTKVIININKTVNIQRPYVRSIPDNDHELKTFIKNGVTYTNGDTKKLPLR